MTNKQKLEKLERENKYLFHGSGFLIKTLEPRQAYQFTDGVNIPDGKPAIFASPFVNYAIFMALINKTNCPKGYQSSSGFDKDKLTFRATKKTLDQLNDISKGYVYILNRTDFTERYKGEWMSYKTVKPIDFVEVNKSDLNFPIDVLN